MMLAIIMLASCFVACDNGGDTTDVNSESDTSLATTPQDSADGSLEVIDWNGELYTILGRDGGAASQFTNFEVGYDELPVDVVGIAVYKRNENLKNKYNFRVVQTLVSDTNETAQVAYESGDDLYDLVIDTTTVGAEGAAHVIKAYLDML